jgi:hypothetical protein
MVARFANSMTVPRAVSEQGELPKPAPHTVAIMQPYFIPYAGYFRLFAASNLFVIYDNVQFPRRGWVHRNRLIDQSGRERWLTLPLQKAARDTLICDLQFATDASAMLEERLRPFGPFCTRRSNVEPILDALRDVRSTPVDYIERLLKEIAGYLGLPWNVMRSSSVAVSPELRGQDRILAIVRRLGARSYVNAPGGRDLYDHQRFADAGIELRFLPDHQGPKASILSRLMVEDRVSLSTEIFAASS